MSRKFTNKRSTSTFAICDQFWLEKGQSCLTLGLLYYQFGVWSRALDCFEKALDAFGNGQNLPSMGQVLMFLGNLYAHLGQYQTAGRYYQRAVYISGKVGADHQIIHALRKLGLMRYCAGSLASSVKLLERAAIYCEYCDCPHEEALTLALLGHLYCQQHKYAFALASYEAALEIVETLPQTWKNIRFQAEMKRGIGQVYEFTSHLDLSLNHYLYAFTLYKHLK